MSRPRHQIIVGASPGDAITDHALLLRRWLRDFGFQSDLFAEHIHADLGQEVRPLAAYRPTRQETWLIFHHSIGSPAVEQALRRAPPLLLVYHNITPPEFFTAIDPAWEERMALGRRQLHALKPRTRLAIADSPYNEAELRAAGFEATAVLPITFDESQYRLPPNPDLLARLRHGGPLLLFIGRLSPNKKQEDLIKLLHYYRRIEPAARLALVGDRWQLNYDGWLEYLAGTLGLGEAVEITGRLSQQDMLTYYQAADLYVSMSEHEGFGKPLLEAMNLGLPVLAYAAAAVPGTLGPAGVLFHRKDFEALAELVDILIKNHDLRRRIIACQKARARVFAEPEVRHRLRHLLTDHGLL